MAERMPRPEEESSRVVEAIGARRRRLRAYVRANTKRVIWAAVIVALGLAAYFYVSSPMKVSYVTAKTITTSETLGATGTVHGNRSANLGVDISGVVRRIHVGEGDSMRAGQLILSLDKSAMDARVRGAQGAISSAEAELSKASRGPLPSEARAARAELSQARRVGNAKVAQAQARLNDIKSGARPQEIGEAQAELRRRQQALVKAQADYKRTADLVKVGALAQTDLEQAQANVDAARTDVDVQQQRLSLLRAGNRPEQIAEARAAVQEAVASRDTSVEAANSRLQTLLAMPRPEDVRAAQSRVAEARADLRQAEDQRAKADLGAPFDGVLASIPVQQGESVTPGQTLAVLQEMSRPVVEVETDEENLAVLSVGQIAVVSSDAFPGRTFQAVLYSLGSQANPERGTVLVKLRPLEGVSWLRPALTMDVNIITKRHVRRIVLPPDCVTRYGGHTVVLVVRSGKAVPVRVKTGAAGPSGVAVFGDLKDGEMIVRNASGVGPNDEVRPVRKR